MKKLLALSLLLCCFGSIQAQGFSISGIITSPQGRPLAGVTVSLVDVAGQEVAIATTAGNGAYSFQNIPGSQEYTIVPSLNRNPAEGVSTLDLIRASRHILQIEALGSPFLVLAGDVNQSQSLTTLDLVNMRSLILGRVSQLPGPSWVFIKADVDFSNGESPWDSITGGYLFLEGPVSGFNFYGIKMGELDPN